MDVELLALGYLSSGPKTGYKLNQIFGNMMLYYAVSLNQIYPVLRNLEAKGHVEKEVVIQVGKPNKNMYSITEEGRKALEQKLTGPPEPMDYHLPFLTRALFFRFLDSDKTQAAFEDEIASLSEQVATLQEMEDTVNERADQNGAFAYKTAVHLLETLISWYQAELDRRGKE
ncbi:DNA-binding transcriptional regulator, PadR family [Desulfatibacillum alkenivorans DSM 16219]|jgi:DNA-binding PadR family transcriptional regulator|uniref:DNA-binding transcriptional regulator, PadR family n=1 Tax=Desulfatibacillum alkenivorans DSM 16219 TaxID=1121393 RepID=A0A1M6T6Q0_9BACT|nr:PadR family transcriptional regulator [Desulfatibacillum alkenivorans]SHK52448.1 DNA-binding transcriptional regulator, PadR family [Desulfatibacillum alkenivorans DSM 16219]